MTDSVAVELVPRVELGVIRADRPADVVARATEAAHALAAVIEDRKLYSNIQGKKFVRAEGWTTLAAMLGCTPHEITVEEQEGAFTAVVELRRIADGQPIARASAECGPDESTWKGRARYARRSMALTRATSKACRLAFSWVMALTGYEVTPAEEIPEEEKAGVGRSSAGRANDSTAAPPPVQSLDEKPRALAEPEDKAPWDALSVTRDTPCPIDPKKRPLADMRPNQLKFVEAYVEAHPEYPKADEWRIVVQKELAAR